MTTTFRPADRFGPVLTGRTVAADLRHEIEDRVANGEHVILDFSHVSMISPSFADELFAKMPHSAWQSQVTVAHLSDTMARFAKFVIANRD